METISVLGVPVAPVTLESLVAKIDQWVREGKPRRLLGVYAHCLNVARRDPLYRAVLNRADLVYADGMAVVWASRLLKRPLPAKIATTDLLPPVCELAVREGYRLYLLGGMPGVADEAARRLKIRYPGLMVAGCRHGYFQPSEERVVIEEVRAVQPHILFVGLGVPKQEIWVETHLACLQVPVVLTCGALFDFYSGRVRRCPGWMTDAGLEWAFRLALEPRRLARRYLAGNAEFTWAVLRQRLFG